MTRQEALKKAARLTKADVPTHVVKNAIDDFTVETRTRSIPTAAALVVAGHQITRIIKRNGSATICFGPEAEDTLLEFIRAKDRIDQQVEETPEVRS